MVLQNEGILIFLEFDKNLFSKLVNTSSFPFNSQFVINK